MDLSIYKTDTTKENNGVWRKIGQDAEALVARSTNPQYRAALAEYYTEFVPVGAPPATVAKDVEKATIYALAKAILLDWKNVFLDGKKLPYTFENAVRVLTDFPDFREVISTIALDSANFKSHKEAAIKK